jgi:aryl-alcohol dehydrogenase-like predicted oxidoreductase
MAVEAVLRRETPDFLQIDYALDDREAEKRLLPVAAETRTAVLTALPFGRGRLFAAVRGRSLPDWAAEFGRVGRSSSSNFCSATRGRPR